MVPPSWGCRIDSIRAAQRVLGRPAVDVSGKSPGPPSVRRLAASPGSFDICGVRKHPPAARNRLAARRSTSTGAPSAAPSSITPRRQGGRHRGGPWRPTSTCIQALAVRMVQQPRQTRRSHAEDADDFRYSARGFPSCARVLRACAQAPTAMPAVGTRTDAIPGCDHCGLGGHADRGSSRKASPGPRARWPCPMAALTLHGGTRPNRITRIALLPPPLPADG
jgi:hypothetical protein